MCNVQCECESVSIILNMFFDIAYIQISEIRPNMNNFNNNLQNQWNQPYFNPQHFTYSQNPQQYQTSQMANHNGSYQNSYPNPNPNQQNQTQSNLSDSILKYNASDLEPYNNQDFLCRTFNFKVQYIQAFLALPSQLKLKFYMSLEEARLYGQIKDREGYQSILRKIAIAVKILQGKPLTEEQKNSQKPKSMEDKINQLCDYQFSKLHISDHQGKKQQQEEQFDSYVSSNEVNGSTNSQNANRIEKNDIFASLDLNGGNKNTPQKKAPFQDLLLKQNADSQQNKKTEDQDDQFGDFKGSSNNKNELMKNQPQFYQNEIVSNLLDEGNGNGNNTNSVPQTYIPTFDELYPNQKKIDPFNVERPKFAWMQKLDEQETFKMGIFDLELDEENPSSKKSIREDTNIKAARQSFFQPKAFPQPLFQQSMINASNSKAAEEEQEFESFTGADYNENVYVQPIKETILNASMTNHKQEQTLIDFKSAYQSYQTQQHEKHQQISFLQNDTVNKQNQINVPQNQSQRPMQMEDILEFQTSQPIKQVQTNLIADQYDIMWTSSPQVSIVTTNEIYENGSLIQIDAPSNVSNTSQDDKPTSQENKPPSIKKISDQMEMMEVQQQDQWNQAVQVNQQEKHVQQIIKTPQTIQFVEVKPEMSETMNYQQSKPMKKIKNFDSPKIEIPQYQFGNGDVKVEEQPKKSNTSLPQAITIDTNKISVIVSPRTRQFNLQKVSSNLNICIGVQEIHSPKRSSKVEVSRKSSNNSNDIQSSVDQNYVENSQYIYPQSEFDQKCEMSHISSPKYRLQNDMNKTHAFPVQRALKKSESSPVETHPLLKPLVVDISTKSISIQLRNNSFECSAQFYLQVINWLQKLQFKNSELYNHLQQQLETVRKIKELTELYTKAVQQDEQDKLMNALKQSKKQYSLLNSEKTKNLINFYIKRGNRSLYYDLCEFLIQKGNVSIQFIQKQLPTRTADSFPYVLVALYVMQKSNLIQSIPVYAAKLNTYILRQYQVYRQACDNLKNMDYQQQQKILKSQKYRAYMIGLGTMVMICKRTSTLAKMSSKSMGSLVKVLKVSKELETQALDYLKQHSNGGKQNSIRQLWTHQANQKIIPTIYCQYTLKQLKMHRPSNQIQAGLDEFLVSIPICKLCLGTQNLSQKQGIKIHTQCWNLYRTVNSQIQEQ